MPRNYVESDRKRLPLKERASEMLAYTVTNTVALLCL
ncbi:MAG: hypothetical protein QOC89_4073 [Paraburkholderia sp.]|nr:hypothetical protein [Paraburkholderia sp.]